MRGNGSTRLCCLLLAVGMLATPAWAAQQNLAHVATIDLGTQFNSTTGYGDNPLSIAFDGTNAYIGGYKNDATSPGTVGVVQVGDLFGTPTFAPLAGTLNASPLSRGYDALAVAAGDLFIGHDSGTAATGFIRRHDLATDSAMWTMSGPQGARPFAMAIDPLGDNGNPGVAFLTQGSGRRRLLSLADGSTIFDGSNGGIINTSPDSGSTWRTVGFDTNGNIVVVNQNAFGYGVRNTNNQWMTLAGGLNNTTRAALKTGTGGQVNNVGQGIVIMEDLGSDLLAFSGRGFSGITDSTGGTQTVDKLQVHIRNLDGTTTGLTQIALLGDEDGIGTAWTSDIKNLAFGMDSLGRPTLLVVSFLERRLDVYVVPEPSALLGLLAGLLVLRRR